MTYNLVYQERAKKDIEEIISYIVNELKNKSAAIKLKNEFMRQEKYILMFPYGSSIYNSKKPLNNNYRRAVAKNFHIFYFIDEEQKLIVVSRVIYNKRNFYMLLN